MNVTILSTSDKRGGAAIAAFRLFKALKTSGFDIKMLVRDKLSDETGVESRDHGIFKRCINFLRFAGERIYFLPFERSKDIRFFFSPANTGEDISRHEYIRNADIINIHWINQGFLSLRDIRKLIETGKPIVWTMHDMWAFTGGCHYSGTCDRFMQECGNCPFLKNQSPHDLSHRVLRKKARVYKDARITIVGSSRWMSGKAKESSLFQGFRIESIPIPVDTRLFCPGDKMQAREKLGLPKDRFLILAGAANMKDRRKGYHFLVNALQFLAKTLPGFSERSALVTFGKADGSADAGIPVYSHHYLSDEKAIALLYQACDLFVLPSLEDNLPNTVIESLSCGIPVVAFRTGGIPEMIVHGKTGYLAGPGDSEDLAGGIEWLFAMPDRNAIEKSCRDEALRTYSGEIAAEKYHSLYKSVLPGNE